MKLILIALFGLSTLIASAASGRWREATHQELAALLPARAHVEQEKIETEMRTASGVTDGHGKYIAGVVLITAGYSAEGKYSHFFVTQVPLSLGDIKGKVVLPPGDYVFSYHREDEDHLAVAFFTAASGKLAGTVIASRSDVGGPIRSFHISPAASGGSIGGIELGRFTIGYELPDSHPRTRR